MSGLFSVVTDNFLAVARKFPRPRLVCFLVGIAAYSGQYPDWAYRIASLAICAQSGFDSNTQMPRICSGAHIFATLRLLKSVRPVGIEPTTLCLKGRCSTD